jgi:hypothetical protein
VTRDAHEPESWEDQRAGSHALVGKTLRWFGSVCAVSGLLAELMQADLQLLTARDVMGIGAIMVLTGVWVGASGAAE